MADYFKRTIKLMIGLMLYGLGVYLGIQANIGLAPWDAFAMGISIQTGLLFGNAALIVSLVVLIVDFFLKEKIGFGTILNGILVGKFVDLYAWIGLMPKMDNFFVGIVVLLLGQVVICFASYFYIGAGFGCGPRDSLMVAMAKKLDKLPIGAVRALIEGTALLIGWLLGAKVGLGTIIAVFGIGTLMESIFRLLHFNVKQIQHEDMKNTVDGIKAALAEPKK